MSEEERGDQNPYVVESRRFGERVIPVVRKLTRDEIEAYGKDPHVRHLLPEPSVTGEGFKIRGRNETKDIVALTSLEGTPLSTLEKELRPRGESYAGFLGEDESFLDRLASDNDIVHSLQKPNGEPLEHTDLLEATLELQAASHYGGNMIIYNPYGEEVFVGTTDSLSGGSFPWPQGTTTGGSNYGITNLRNGASVLVYSASLGAMARGFYQGQTSYRHEPREIAETTGIIPIPDSDPVAQLVLNPGAAQTFTTGNQLKRLRQLFYVRNGELSTDNIQINCSDPTTYLEALTVASDEDAILKDHGQKKKVEDEFLKRYGRPISNRPLPDPIYIPKRSIIENLDTTSLTPGTIQIGSRRGYTLPFVDPGTLYHTVPSMVQEIPDIMERVLASIQDIEFPADGLESVEDFAKDIVITYKHLVEDALPFESTGMDSALRNIRRVLNIPSNQDRNREAYIARAQATKEKSRAYYQALLQKVKDQEGLKRALEKIKSSYDVEGARAAKEEVERFIDRVVDI